MPASASVFPSELLRTTSFRLALVASLILSASTAGVFALLTWRATAYEHARVDRVIALEAETLARGTPATARRDVDRHFSVDLHSLPIAGVFDRAGRALAGNLRLFPAALPIDGKVHEIPVAITGGRSLPVRATATRLSDGTLLVVGRDMGELTELRAIVRQSLALAFIPALLLSLAGGAVIGVRTLRRVRAMHRAIDRIVAGGLHERLPIANDVDDVDRLAASVNRMLERLELLVREVRSIGDDIAHDIRTPLARCRATLERARLHDLGRDTAQDAIGRAIGELDRVFALVTALLRIREIETAERRTGFAPVTLAAIATDAVELYEPIADANGIALALAIDATAPVRADPDLLMEAIANLLDNALKFTPAAGHVRVTVREEKGHGVLVVDDDGIGMTDDERRSVLKRFYRADRSRHVPGNGLGLSLVAAIMTLHDGVVRVAASETGSRFALSLPLAAAPPPLNRATAG